MKPTEEALLPEVNLAVKLYWNTQNMSYTDYQILQPPLKAKKWLQK